MSIALVKVKFKADELFGDKLSDDAAAFKKKFEAFGATIEPCHSPENLESLKSVADSFNLAAAQNQKLVWVVLPSPVAMDTMIDFMQELTTNDLIAESKLAPTKVINPRVIEQGIRL